MVLCSHSEKEGEEVFFACSRLQLTLTRSAGAIFYLEILFLIRDQLSLRMKEKTNMQKHNDRSPQKGAP